ncbi:hypothetical protein HU200_012549 [Digitaria exilis]|uniref:Uncharacterized protein n=1 Tax=Digitaria exilis TaxID=1010633 RepID=A0A835FE10_9POAL|nr:hypothetical protein HU200_012549 [Digitaria exilis]
MKITVQSSKAVKPTYGDGGAPSVAADTIKLTVLDKVNFDQYISTLYFFSPQAAKAPPNVILEQGLSKTLAVHREWAGRFGLDANGDRAILLNDEGVRFVEATADVTLSTIMPVEPMPELLKLYPSNNGADELVLVQVTRFACGSLVVSIAGNHLVSDGYGRCSFMMAWSNATRCVAVPPHDRTSLSIVLTPRNPARIEFEHRGIEFKQPRCSDTLDNMEEHASASGGGDKVIVHRVHFSAEMVSKLKALALSPSSPRSCSTVKCMVSHLWRCISKARGLDRETPTTLKIAVNGRRRMRHPEVPEGYTGNVVLWACPTTTVGELLAKPLWHVAELVSREVATSGRSSTLRARVWWRKKGWCQRRTRQRWYIARTSRCTARSGFRSMM